MEKPRLQRFVRHLLIVGLLIAASSSGIWTTAQTQTEAQPAAPVFRAPFDLKLRVDDQHSYQEHFDKVPYVADSTVYLFCGESFGINLMLQEGKVVGVSYQADPTKADLLFTFSQQGSGLQLLTLLKTENKTRHKIAFDALMTVPQKKGIFKTSILPVEPQLVGFESWPHPIVQLVLRNFSSL